MSQNPQGIVYAAGGLLWRSVNGANEVAIVFRNRYGDWTLPKGKLQGSEDWQQAALREVREETGYNAIILGFAGAVTYQVPQGTKVVCFWHMRPVGEPEAQLDNEVAEIHWLSAQAALEKIHYPLEKALLEIWSGPMELKK